MRYMLLVSVLFPTTAFAIPRFAARNSMECIQCHINPTGGGARNAYGKNVFEQAWLPMQLFAPDTNNDDWVLDAKEDAQPTEESLLSLDAFSGLFPDSWSIGGDLRGAYIWIHPDRGPDPDTKPDITNSFFLMQADLYFSAQLNKYVTLLVDTGIYSGFEAWALLDFLPDDDFFGLRLKVGRFLPPFGIREVEHQLFTREGVGLGATDRDTGIELTGYVGPLTANIALLNGTLGDTFFDTAGSRRRKFEKAIATRVSYRLITDYFRLQIGGSFYFNENMNQPNPLFSTAVPIALAANASEGGDEIRAGGFVTLNIGRLTYLGELVVVRDGFFVPELGELVGHATYQEISFVAFQGLEIIGTHEFMDPDADVLRNTTHRLGLVVEAFVLPYTEVRVMMRRTISDASPTGGTWDLVIFLHVFS